MPRSREIFRALKCGAYPTDPEFDEVFSEPAKRLSELHWTPVDVAVCAAEMLVADRSTKVLDVGCGSGKFCLIGAATQAASFSGIDQRRHLLAEGQAIAGRVALPNVEFIHGNMEDLDWTGYDAFYLYNPFLENVCMPAMLDDTVPLRPEYYFRYVETVQQKLRRQPIGTRVVTYHGFGGEMPYGYRMIEKREIGSDFLQCWVKDDDFRVQVGATRTMAWRG